MMTKQGPDHLTRSYTPSSDQACLSVCRLDCHPAFAHICPCNYSSPGKPAAGVMPHNLGKVPSQNNMSPAVAELVTRRRAFLPPSYHYLSSPSGNSGCCMLLEKKNNDLPTNTYPCRNAWWGQTKAKISHSNTVCT